MPKWNRGIKWCHNCKEKSIISKTYHRKSDGQFMYYERCMNKCGYEFSHAIPLVIHNADGDRVINIQRRQYDPARSK